MENEQELLVRKVCEIYEELSKLDNLNPSKQVNSLFTKLVLACIPTCPIDVTKLSHKVSEIRSKLIILCGKAEGLLESHYSTLIASYENPLSHITLFPYHSNYLKLSHIEFKMLTQNLTQVPKKAAFVGSGPLPLTSIVLASNHLTNTSFDNYDIDPTANSKASKLVSSCPDLSQRMSFHTTDIMEVPEATLKGYEVVFLAALVGMDKAEKTRVIEHLAKNMAPGATLLLRSAHGARVFLYPVIDPCSDLQGFEVLSVYHPSDEVINSIIVARKRGGILAAPTATHTSNTALLPSNCKCSEMHGFNLLTNHGNMIEELITVDEKSA